MTTLSDNQKLLALTLVMKPLLNLQINIILKQLQKFKDFGEEDQDIMDIDPSQKEQYKKPVGAFIIDIIIWFHHH